MSAASAPLLHQHHSLSLPLHSRLSRLALARHVAFSTTLFPSINTPSIHAGNPIPRRGTLIRRSTCCTPCGSSDQTHRSEGLRRNPAERLPRPGSIYDSWLRALLISRLVSRLVSASAPCASWHTVAAPNCQSTRCPQLLPDTNKSHTFSIMSLTRGVIASQQTIYAAADAASAVARRAGQGRATQVARSRQTA